MNVITKKEFDDQVAGRYTPQAHHTDADIEAGTYEAYMDTIQELIDDSFNESTIENAIVDAIGKSAKKSLVKSTVVPEGEPVYIILIGEKDIDPAGYDIYDELDQNMKTATELSDKGLLHGLIFVNVGSRRVRECLTSRDYTLRWNVRELHVFDDRPHGMGSDFPPIAFDILNEDLIKHVGLHGHSHDLWNLLRLYELPIDELSMKSMGVDRDLTPESNKYLQVKFPLPKMDI